MIFNPYLNVGLIGIVGLNLAAFLVGASIYLSEQKPYTLKLQPYECGFLPYNQNREPFEVKFFIVGIIFLLFDLELARRFPMVINLDQIGEEGIILVGIFFIRLVIGV